MIYYGTRLSENISRREPEGYLLCLNVPVARTGTQEYMPEELDLPPGSDPVLFFHSGTEGVWGAGHSAACVESDRKALQSVPVYRPESEVFSPETIASFEGMPVTNNHPPDGVTVDNIRAFQKGHAHNVRRGAGNESDLLLADLIITDPALIEAILGGKREISCGYTYVLCEENGQYIQRKIRGNHVAVVDAGRAGHRVSIKDGQPSGSPVRTAATLPERRKPHMKKSLLKKLTRMARDGDPEAIEALAEAVEEIMENPSDTPETAVVIAAGTEPGPAAGTAGTPEEPPAAADTDVLSAILERLDRLIALLAPAVPAADDDPEEPAETAGEAADPETPETAAAEIASLVEELIDPAASAILEQESDEDEEESCAPALEAGDALRAALRAIRPALKRMPRGERKRVCADIAANLKSTGMDSGAYAGLMAAGYRRPANPADLGKQIMASRNPNYK